MTEEQKGVGCYLAISNEEYANRNRILAETFKGEVEDKKVLFPKGLGAAHPFDFTDVDKILNNIGIANAFVDKITDAIIGDFSVKVDNENSQALLDDLVNETNLKARIRPWVKEAVGKGNGFMELDLDDLKNIEKLRVMNANNMYVRRNKKGKVLEYNQYKGKLKLFNITSKKIIPFKPNQIAHLTINKTPNDPYGRGLVWCNRATIENYASSELDRVKLISKKAGAPYHVKLGVPGQKVRKGDMNDFKSNLQYTRNSTEWVTDANVDITNLSIPGVGDNLTKAAEHDLEQLALGMKLPMSIVGISNNPEGLAKVNDKGFLRFIDSVRLNVGGVLENQVFRPFLRSQNPKLDEQIEFIWELPGEDEKIARLTTIKDALGLFDISPELRAALEIEYADVMELDVVDKLPTPEEARKKADEEEAELKKQEDQARKAEENIKQPEVPGAKKTANQSIEKCKKPRPRFTESDKSNMKLREYVNLKEIAGFNYSDYLVKILRNLRTEKFEDLLALTERDLLEGLLPKKDINKLRIVLKDGFRKNKTISQIEREIKNSIPLKDRVQIQEDGSKKITLSASKRPINITRTETVRLANLGLKDMYKENDVSSFRWLTALDERTCPICEGLNGQVFLTKDGMSGVNMPPAHNMCRCSIVGLVD